MKIWVVASIAVVLISCGEEKKSEKAEKTEKTMVSEEAVLAEMDSLLSQQTFSKETIDAIIITAETFANNFPEHKHTPGILFTAAVNAQKMGDILVQSKRNGRPYFEKAVEFCDRLIGNYPDFRDLRMVYELKVNTLDTELERDEEAISIYEFLIKTYPQDTFNVSNWQNRIEHIDEDPTDLILKQVE